MNPEVPNRDKVLLELQTAALQKVEAPDGKDEYIRCLGQAALELIDSDKAVQTELLNIYKHRYKHNPIDRLAGYIWNLVRVDVNRNHLGRDRDTGQIFKKRLLGGQEAQYPWLLEDPDMAKAEIRRSLHLDDPLQHNIELHRREVQSNPYQRGRILKLLGLINRDRVGSHPTTLDFGCSRNLVLKWLAQNNQKIRFPMDEVIVYGSKYPRTEAVYERTDVHRTTLMNTYLQTRFYPGRGHGVDVWPVRNAADELWVASCVYPRELEDQRRLRIFNSLKQDVEGVTFSEAQCEDINSLQESVPKGKWNYVFVSMVLHQNSDENRRRIIENAEHYAQDFVVVFDAAIPDDSSPYGLKIDSTLYSEKKPYNMRILVKDMRDPDKGFQDLMRTRDGRFKNVIVNSQNPVIRAAFGK